LISSAFLQSFFEYTAVQADGYVGGNAAVYAAADNAYARHNRQTRRSQKDGRTAAAVLLFSLFIDTQYFVGIEVQHFTEVCESVERRHFILIQILPYRLMTYAYPISQFRLCDSAVFNGFYKPISYLVESYHIFPPT
jgi:hypothetical protein